VTPLWLESQPESIIKQWTNDSRLSGASYGVILMDAKSGKSLYAHNAKQLLVPASTLKLFTTGAALAILGPKYRFETTIGFDGFFDKSTGTLNGNLIIKSNGDVTLNSEHFDTLLFLKKWINQLKKIGLKKINGSVIANSNFWKPKIPDHWIWGDISNYFGASPSPISYRDNKFTILLSSGSEGSKVKVTEVVPTYLQPHLNITCEVVARGNTDQAYVYGDPNGYSKSIHGSIPPNRKRYAIEATLPQPDLWLAAELHHALIAEGVSITDTYRREPDQNLKQTAFFIHYSPTLDRIVNIANLHSNNLFTEGLVYAIGNGDYALGIESIKKYWVSQGVSPQALIMYDGCGLSRSNLVTPQAFQTLLVKTFNDSILGPVIIPSLPVSGKNGSMSQVGKGTILEGNMKAKTGYIEHVRAYTGFLKNKAGRDLAFVILLNNYTCSPSEARKLIEKLMMSFIS